MLEENLRINEPGLNVLPPGVERYVINGGGLTGVQIFPDDEIEIINNEGNQICEIVVFNSDGNSDPSILNLKSSKSENDIIKILNRNEESSKIALRQLEKRNLKITKSKSSILFDKDTPPGEKIKIISKRKKCIIFSHILHDTLYFFGKDIFGIENSSSHGQRLNGPFGDEYVVGSYLSKLFFFSLMYFFINDKE